MSLRIVIPARYGSTRLPGKPLLPIAGVPLLQRVWALGVSVVGPDQVLVATDDERIASFCDSFGAAHVMTDPALANGTIRAHAAVAGLPASVDKVINLQGDAALTAPWVIKALIDEMDREPSVGIFTPAVAMSAEALASLRAAKAAGEVGGTTVTFDQQKNALYFSKSIIPFVRDGATDVPVFRHIGLYAYRRTTLAQVVALPPTPLEQVEKLEQLRPLEHGLKIRVVTVDYRGRSHIGVDSEQDRQRAERLIAEQGELLATYDGSARLDS